MEALRASRGVDRRSRSSTERLNAERRAELQTMIDSEDYPFMTVGELARALGVPRDSSSLMLTNSARFACICQITTEKLPRSFERGGPLRFPRSARFALP